MTRKPCEDAGHCRHTPDGLLYQRHSGNEPGSSVETRCCWCADLKTLPAHSYHTLESATELDIPHGKYSGRPE